MWRPAVRAAGRVLALGAVLAGTTAPGLPDDVLLLWALTVATFVAWPLLFAVVLRRQSRLTRRVAAVEAGLVAEHTERLQIAKQLNDVKATLARQDTTLARMMESLGEINEGRKIAAAVREELISAGAYRDRAGAVQIGSIPVGQDAYLGSTHVQTAPDDRAEVVRLRREQQDAAARETLLRAQIAQLRRDST